jgi:hypothetical protein
MLTQTEVPRPTPRPIPTPDNPSFRYGFEALMWLYISYRIMRWVLNTLRSL